MSRQELEQLLKLAAVAVEALEDVPLGAVEGGLEATLALDAAGMDLDGLATRLWTAYEALRGDLATGGPVGAAPDPFYPQGSAW